MHAPEQQWLAVEGSLLLVDISGFTKLSERLARRGRIGAEELTSVLNRVFDRMLSAAYDRGGSLLKFGGDALLLLFSTADHALQACAAGVEMRAALRDAAQEPTSAGRIKLRMSSGIHSGPIDLFLVGDSHRELIVTGPAASATTEMEATADAGEIVVSDTVRTQLPKDFVGVEKGRGWILRKRKIAHPKCGLTEGQAPGDDHLRQFVPTGLRTHLSSGIADSEHRLATIGFVKFKGVDALLAELGPDAVAQQLNLLVTAAQRGADREGVTFLSTDIDADGGKIILAAGVPASHHDDEGRMLRAARTLLDADCGLSIRVGVNRGHVFSGDVGSSYRRTYTVMGDTVNLAARLMAAAGPRSMYSSPGVVDRSSTLFRTEPLEPFYVKGKERQVHSFEVFEETGTRTTESNTELPFRGRQAELAKVLDIVTTCARSGRGGMTTITGDTGIGKSRLMSEVIGQCDGLDILPFQAEPNGQDNPYWAMRDSLRRALGVERGPQPEMVEALYRVVLELDPRLEQTLPLLGDVLHIEIPETERTVAIDPQFRPDRTADALIELLAALYSQPLAILVEDGHWLDDASIKMLRRVGTAAETRKWTVIFTARHEGTDFAPPGEEIALRPLDDDATRAIVIESTEAAPLRPHEVDAVIIRADGNPLFLSEILGVVKETGSADNLPESLDAVLSSEIDTLPPLTRQLLMYASVLGRSFNRDLLDMFLTPDDVELDDATSKELQQFIEADGDRLRFRHAVVHDTAYQGLSFKRRRELHARAAELVERLAGDNPEASAEFLGANYSAAGLWDKAWCYARVAADHAKGAYANTEAATHYERAIEAAEHVGSIASDTLADVWRSLAEVQELTGRFEEARRSLSRALRVADEDPARIVDIHILRAGTWMMSGDLRQAKRNVTMARRKVGDDDLPQTNRLLARLNAFESSVHAANGDPVRAFRAASKAADLARESEEQEALARAFGVLDWANFAMGANVPRKGVEAIEILEKLGLIERSVGVMNNLGAFSYLEGNWDESIAWYQRAVTSAQRSGNVLEAARTQANIAEVLIGQGKLGEAAPLIDETERVFVSSNSVSHLPFVKMLKGRLMLGQGAVAAAVAVLEQLFGDQLATGDTAEDPEIVVHLADGLIASGQDGEALERIERFESAAPDDALEIAPGLNRVRGKALQSAGQFEDARQTFAAALNAAVEDGNYLEELLTRESILEQDNRAGEPPDPIHVSRLDVLITQLGVVRPNVLSTT